MIYALVKNQVTEHNGIKEIEGSCLFNVISLYKVDNPQSCYEQVVAAGRELLNT